MNSNPKCQTLQLVLASRPCAHPQDGQPLPPGALTKGSEASSPPTCTPSMRQEALGVQPSEHFGGRARPSPSGVHRSRQSWELWKV